MFVRRLGVLVAFSLLAACASETGEASDSGGQEVNAATAPAQNPAIGSPDRAPFMAAVHRALDPRLKGQPNEYVVSWLQSKNGVTLLQAEVRGKGAPIDWARTDFAQQVRSGEFQQADGSHKVLFTAAARKTGPGAFEIFKLNVEPHNLCISVGGFIVQGVPSEIMPAIDTCIDGDGDGDGDAPPAKP